MKFLKFCREDEEKLTFDIVDFSLCSPDLLFKFVDTMQGDWKLGRAGRIGYLDAIAGLVDFRKSERNPFREVVFNRNVLKKGAKNLFQNVAIAMDRQTRYWNRDDVNCGNTNEIKIYHRSYDRNLSNCKFNL